MSTTRFHFGFERKIGYSFVGLLAGNLASLILLLLAALVLRIKWFDEIRNLWSLSIGQVLVWSWLILIFSMLAWVVIGLPIALLLRAEIAGNLRWFTAALIGAVLGILAMLLILLTLNGGRVNVAMLSDFGAHWPFYLAAPIAGIAFVVYCKLVKVALRTQARKSGARARAPQFFSIF